MTRIVLTVVLVACLPRWSEAQGTVVSPASPFQGSVPRGTPTVAPLMLTLRDAIERGLATNLGLLESAQDVRASRAAWLNSVSNLLPNVTATVSRTTEQVNLASLGFTNIPGVPLPTVLGPFSYVDARAFVSQSVFNWSDISSARSASASRVASDHAYNAARELVVNAVANAYLVAIADAALVDATRAQLDTAIALHQKTVDQNQAGVVASIDVLRARVQLQTERQRLIAAENQLATDKLRLARVIGLPNGQAVTLTDVVPYRVLSATTVEQALERAYASRPDFQAVQAQVRAGELAREAAAAERLPSVSVDLNYGDIGSSFGRSHGTFTAVGAINIPIFQGTTVRSKVLQADATLTRTRAELDDLAGKIDYDVRTAFLNLASANELVAVAMSSVDLAMQTLGQAQDRLAAGVADNLEVIQAQESVADANQTYISSVYAHNAAKVSLALATGTAEQSTLTNLGVK